MEAVKFESKLVCTTKDNQALLKNAASVLFGSLLLAISAQITIPLQPVPVTLQSFAALFIGMAFGPKIGSKIILLYLCEGVCGLPFFANFTCGLPVLLGPTGGYLLGFIPSAILTGYLLQIGWARSYITILLSAILGTIVLFIPGYLWLSKFIGFYPAFQLGVIPFFTVEIIKLIIFTFVTPLLWKKILSNENIETQASSSNM